MRPIENEQYTHHVVRQRADGRWAVIQSTPTGWTAACDSDHPYRSAERAAEDAGEDWIEETEAAAQKLASHADRL